MNLITLNFTLIFFSDIRDDGFVVNSCYLESESDIDHEKNDSGEKSVADESEIEENNKTSSSLLVSRGELIKWAFDFSSSNAAVGALLGLLQRSHTHLSKDPRTLLGTLHDINYEIKLI